MPDPLHCEDDPLLHAPEEGPTGPHASLAEVAYDAYCRNAGGKSLVTGQDLPPFGEQDTRIQQAWAAAAAAVVAASREAVS